MNSKIFLGLPSALAVILASGFAQADDPPTEAATGFLVQARSEGWLTGVVSPGFQLGYRGPWGTSYPANLRLTAQKLTEDDWAALKQRNGLPPMPWVSLHSMDERDLRAIYAYIKSLPVKGDPTPNAVPPTQEPTTPYFWFVPITGPAPAAPPAHP